MNCNFFQIFGDYVNSQENRQMLANSRLLSVELYKEENTMNIKSEFFSLVESETLEKISGNCR